MKKSNNKGLKYLRSLKKELVEKTINVKSTRKYTKLSRKGSTICAADGHENYFDWNTVKSSRQYCLRKDCGNKVIS